MASISVSISAHGTTLTVQADTTDPEVLTLANELHLKLAARATSPDQEAAA